LRQGWPLPEAYELAQAVVTGRVVRLNLVEHDVSFKVTKVLKGASNDLKTITVSTRYIPVQGSSLAVGDEYLVFYMEDAGYGNPAMRVAEITDENLETLNNARNR
jgi:hypothetical protein